MASEGRASPGSDKQAQAFLWNRHGGKNIGSERCDSCHVEQPVARQSKNNHRIDGRILFLDLSWSRPWKKKKTKKQCPSPHSTDRLTGEHNAVRLIIVLCKELQV